MTLLAPRERFLGATSPFEYCCKFANFRREVLTKGFPFVTFQTYCKVSCLIFQSSHQQVTTSDEPSKAASQA